MKKSKKLGELLFAPAFISAIIALCVSSLNSNLNEIRVLGVFLLILAAVSLLLALKEE